MLFTGSAVAHFLNCLIDSSSSVTNSPVIYSVLSQYENISDLVNLKKNNKKKRKPLSAAVQQNANTNVNENNEKDKTQTNVINKHGGDWLNLNQHHLWELMAKDAAGCYGYNLESSNCDQFIEWSKAQRLSIVRRFCILVGIQLVSKVFLMLFFHF